MQISSNTTRRTHGANLYPRCGIIENDWKKYSTQGSRRMPEFKVEAPFQPTGDQPDAIAQLVESIEAGNKHQTLLGVTGSGKTYTVAKVIEQVQKPTLVLA